MGLCCGGKKNENKDYKNAIQPLEKGKLPGKVAVNKQDPVKDLPKGAEIKQEKQAAPVAI